MNSNRNRYSSAPTYGMQKRTAPKKAAGKKAPPPQQPQTQGMTYPNQPIYPPQGMMPPQPGGMVYPGANQPAMPPQSSVPYGYAGQMNATYPTPSAGSNQVGQQMMGYPPVNPAMPPMYTQPPYGQQAPVQPPVQSAPQPMPKQPKAKRKDTWLQLLMLLLLPILFIAAMITKQTPLFWVFIGFALVGLAAMWLQSTFVSSARATLSLVYGALLIVSAVTIFTGGGFTRDATTTSAAPNISGVTAQNNPVQPSSSYVNTEPSVPSNMFLVDEAPQQSNPYLIEYTPEPSVTSEASAQLDSFMYLWNANKLDEMVSLCAPSWSTGLDDARKSLYAILANRLPMDYTMEKITGTDADSSRTITMTVTIDKQNNRAPGKYRFQVLMLKENGTWYVDPQSLKSNESAETATPAPDATATPAPTAPPSGKTKLYYNSEGGKYYHAQEHCPSISEEYYSKMKSFYYQDLDGSKFKSLKPCSKCKAPARP